MMTPTLTANDRRWRAEEDARTLAEATVIQESPVRLTKAKQAANRLAKEQQARAKAISQVASGKKPTGESKYPKKRKSKPAPVKTPSYNVFEKLS